ncbi:fatty acid desaturase-domain-containing protein [Desarmillaria tabescens]|uniref:Fatty acid desaturase-domain-containing protein n=1 Tax=Armillaria tabescens TaxID=1929756 RepID=A0AA39JXC9_ARMTA|nr:fatty acid desaturase-domain-containing protein [Desarmillaria tabescens]KAK0448348.1 fatty acid desaturase-domain-containing protein [Desarmillaria tabescens]
MGLTRPNGSETKDACIRPTPEDEARAFREAFAITTRHKARDNVMGALTILNNYVVFAACVWMCEYVASHYSNVRLWWATYIPAIIVISSRMRAMEHLVHEASHNNIFTNPRAHEYTEFLYAFPVFRLLKVFRTLHLEHHKYLGDPVRDADVVRLQYLGFIGDERLSAARFSWLIFGLPFSGWLHYEYVVTLFTEFWTSPASYPWKVIYWVTVLTAVHLSNKWSGFALYYVVPWFGVLTITRYWAEVGEHLGMDMTGNFGNSRTNDGFLQRWWIHPLNDGLHAAHHLNSQVPFHKLRRAHKELMREVPAYREKNTMSNGITETFWQIYECPTVIKAVAEQGQAEWQSGQVWAKR